jgi:hypothetical protein
MIALSRPVFWIALLGLLTLGIGIGRVVPCADAAPTALQIENLRASAATVGLYEKFELTFTITGSGATNPYFPYDPAPPPGVPASVGITVDALFSPDNWTSVITQPAFLYQPYERRCIVNNAIVTNCPADGEEWLYPTGDPVWKVRFAPQQLGDWKYRVRATDASGTVQTAEEDSPSCRPPCRTTTALSASARPIPATLNIPMARPSSASGTARDSPAGALPTMPTTRWRG